MLMRPIGGAITRVNHDDPGEPTKVQQDNG